jgi:hypothetical protein
MVHIAISPKYLVGLPRIISSRSEAQYWREMLH